MIRIRHLLWLGVTDCNTEARPDYKEELVKCSNDKCIPQISMKGIFVISLASFPGLYWCKKQGLSSSIFSTLHRHDLVSYF